MMENYRRQQGDAPRSDKMLKVRNILNLIFMLCVVIGIIIYFNSGQTKSAYFFFAAIAVKMIEITIRLIKR